MSITLAQIEEVVTRGVVKSFLPVKVRILEMQYRNICYQCKRYDNLSNDSIIPEEKKKSAYKVLVLKVTALESELANIKKQLQIA